MVKPNNELNFSMSDLYPNWGGIDTSQLAVPESDDLRFPVIQDRIYIIPQLQAEFILSYPFQQFILLAENIHK